MSQIDRCLTVLELLFQNRDGLQLSEISDAADIPKSAAHRLLTQLKNHGYVEQRESGAYKLSLLLPALGQEFLVATGFKGLMQPLLDRMAADCGELVRLAALSNGELIWVLHAAGSRYGLRYDGLRGVRVVPHVTATGKTWLSTLSDEEATRIVSAWKLGADKDRYGPNAVSKIRDLLDDIEAVRKKAIAEVHEEAEVGVSAMAVALFRPGPGGAFLGTLSIAGPSSRLTKRRMKELTPLLGSYAREASQIWDKYLQASGEAVGASR